MDMLRKFLTFVNKDLWRLRPGELPRKKFFLIRSIRCTVLTFRGFFDDNCMLRSSALTFYTLMSIVPVFALGFAIAKGFGYEKVLEREILENFAAHGAFVENVLEFAKNYLEKTKGGLIAGVGIFLLLLTVFKLLSNIEKAFNEIWGIKKDRSFGRKLGDYLIITAVAPFFLVLSSSITVVVTSFLSTFTESALSSVFNPLIYLTLKLIPFIILWFVFTFIYMFIPNTRVNFRSGICAGIIAGSAFQIAQNLYVSLQFGVTKYNAIYGSFAALPLFLMWLEMSWMIVLLGAELAYAFQNVDTYEFEPDSKMASISIRRLVALFIVSEICKRFENADSPLTAQVISQRMEIPPSLANRVIHDLEKCGLISKVEASPGDQDLRGYHPATSTEKLSVQYVLQKLEDEGSNDIPVKECPQIEKIKASLDNIRQAVGKSKGNILLRDA
ncbi:MAG: YihY family inner membrane protein [Victivallales bacterium]|nr:YihY family inner membrane protein [Victivallales bacterium]